MELIVIGLNHNTAPLHIRERFAFSATAAARALAYLKNHEDICEAVLLSTCNRTELYAVLDNTVDASHYMRRLLLQLTDQSASPPATETDYFYLYTNNDCVRHLLKVAASLDSQILGENQILGQIKNAYALAHAAGTTKTILNVLFHRAITAGKKVRTQTTISQNPVSISTAAIELAREHYGDLTRLQVLLIGAGKMGHLTVNNLQKRGCSDIVVANRNFEHARTLAHQMQCRTVSFAEITAQAVTANIIVTSTAAPDYVLDYAMVAEIAARREGKPLLLIDIAVPRDIDPTPAQYPASNCIISTTWKPLPAITIF